MDGTVFTCPSGFSSAHYFVGVRNGRIHYIFVLELHDVRESLALRCFDMACMRAIMLWGCCNIPPINGMICSRASFFSFSMDLDGASHWSKRHFVVIKWLAEMDISRNIGSCI